MVVWNSRVAEEYCAQVSAGPIEQIRPIALNLPVMQQVKAEPVPVEAQAHPKIVDHHHGMMNASGHSTQG